MKHIDGDLLKKMIVRGSQLLEEAKVEVDDLNVFPVPDGDTGTNMALTMNSAMNQVIGVDTINVGDVAKALANGALMGARGNSGVILSQIFRGFSKSCKGNGTLDAKQLAQAFKLASDTAYEAVMRPIEGTILTIIRSMSEKALEIKDTEEDIPKMLEEIIKHGEKTLLQTPNMLKVLKEAGVVDAGGKGLLIIVKGFYQGLTGNVVLSDFDKSISLNKQERIQNEDIEFGYCTEFIIKGDSSNIPKFKESINVLGDSMLVVGAEDIVKVHIHTNNPGKVLEEALKLGHLIDIKIDNMRYQHENKVVNEEAKEYGIVAIAMGDGMKDIFLDMNVDQVIVGGQTMNPSTQDIKMAIDKINAKNIIILPNNSNIILAANQAKELSEKNIVVVPTKTIPQGIGALMAFSSENEIGINEENMKEAIANIKTGQVTYSVRETTFKGQSIKKDDILGICNGEIEVVGDDVFTQSYELLKRIIDDESEIITIFYGEDSTEEEANKLASKIEEEYEDCDVEIYYGGQPLYYYIFSVE